MPTASISYADGLAELMQLISSGARFTASEVYAIAAKVTTDVMPGMTQGSITLLYSGPVDGVSSSNVIKAMMDQGLDGGVRLLDKTQVGQFLSSLEFKL